MVACVLVPTPHSDAKAMEAHVVHISEANRAVLLESRPAAVPQLRPQAELPDPEARLVTSAGAVVTLRLARPTLLEFCAMLPGSDRCLYVNSTIMAAAVATATAGAVGNHIVAAALAVVCLAQPAQRKETDADTCPRFPHLHPFPFPGVPC